MIFTKNIALPRDGELKRAANNRKQDRIFLENFLENATINATMRLSDICYLNHGIENHGSSILGKTPTIPENEGENPFIYTAKLTLDAKANKCDEIIKDSLLKEFYFTIIEGANSYEGINKKNKGYKNSLSANNEVGPWGSYNSFVEMYKDSFSEEKIPQMRGEIVDYILLGAFDPASDQKIQIEMGNLPIRRLGFLESFKKTRSIKTNF